MKRKVLALCLTLTMIAVPFNAFAEQSENAENASTVQSDANIDVKSSEIRY